jgi:glycosyltransferase involved in cell wall biosynthesis
MKIVIASTYVPFIRGGGTKIVDDLAAELTHAGHRVDCVRLPLYSYWRQLPEQTLALRLLDLTESSGETIDRLITIRYPSYALSHPNKVAWFIHHHRAAYDLWGTEWGDMPDTPEGRRLRDAMRRSDTQYLREARRVYTNSGVVADRLKTFNGITADGVLYPPLPREHPFRPGPHADRIVYVSRLCPIKRQGLAIEAMKHAAPGFKLVLAGAADVPSHLESLRERTRQLGVEDRVEFRGWVSEADKAELLANCAGTLYLAKDEDSYGYSSLEAFHAGKPVITLTDSGATRELIEDSVNGRIVPPRPEALAEAMGRLVRDRQRAEEMGENARRTPEARGITWDHVVEKLTQ